MNSSYKIILSSPYEELNLRLYTMLNLNVADELQKKIADIYHRIAFLIMDHSGKLFFEYRKVTDIEFYSVELYKMYQETKLDLLDSAYICKTTNVDIVALLIDKWERMI